MLHVWNEVGQHEHGRRAKSEQHSVNSEETPPTSNGCKNYIINYLNPHHTTTPPGCSVSRTLHYVTRPLNRAMGTLKEKTLEPRPL